MCNIVRCPFFVIALLPRSRGPAKGAKDVGLSSNSRPKFKRNSGKFKPKSRGKPVVRGKEKEKRAQPSVGPGSDGEAVITTGAKRKRQEQQGEGKQEGDKRFKGNAGVPAPSGLGTRLTGVCVLVCVCQVQCW